MLRAAAAPATLARPAVDLATLGLILLTYTAFGLVTWFHALLPWWALAPIGAIIVCFHGSLQHEAVHGYPFHARWANTALMFPSLNLWMPYTLYRHTHLVHHRDEDLTLPGIDPESFYVDPIRWQRMSRWQRRIMQATNTLFGRLLLGPAVIAWVTGAQAIRNIAAGDMIAIRDWSLHLLGLSAIGIWVVGVCGMNPLVYIACFAYPGTSLTLLRSFAEHRAAHEPGGRTAIVEADWFFGLLYLFNSYHVVHHNEPGLAWYRRPRQFHARRDEYLTDNGGYHFGGYREIARRYWLRSKEPVAHPLRALNDPVQP
ncbi:MAG: fatty acid desaturase [Dongiaceae bacterium]